jgi:enoyl-CoA hydratase/carnithine racemase
MSYQDVILNREKGWVEITINRPEKLNSLREQTADEILGILNEVEHDRDVRAVILLGSEKAFCTGIEPANFRSRKTAILISTGSARGPGR